MAIGMLLCWSFWHRTFPGAWILASVVGLLLAGLVDDRFGMRARTKFLLQAAIAGVGLALDGSLLHVLGELLPGVDFRFGVAAALLVTVFGAVGVINGMNMLDGLDGLGGGVALVAIGWFGFAAWRIDDGAMVLTHLSIAGAICGFLLFNAPLPGRARARLFMGDAGSMVLGFLLVWVAIDLSQRSHGMPPVVALWICAMPILDTTAVVIDRRRNGRAVSCAGRDHLHHLLRHSGLSVRATVSLESLLGFLMGGTGVALWQLGFADWQIFVSFLAAAAVYVHLFLLGWSDFRASELFARGPSSSALDWPR